MKVYVLFVLGGLLCCLSAWGQRSMAYREIPSGISVFSGKDNEAGMVFFCPSEISLSFQSSLRETVDVYLTEKKGDNTVYYIRFKVGRKYRGRKLSVLAPGYNSLTFEVEMAPKELRQYSLFDPNEAFVNGCYAEFRKRGRNFFQQGMYQEAREQYMTALECSDRPVDTDLKERIADIDAITSYLERAESAVKCSDYNTARTHLMKALMLNPNDQAIQVRKRDVEQLYLSDCSLCAEQAEAYYKNGEREKAMELFDRMVAQNCLDSENVSKRTQRIFNRLSLRKQKGRVIVYEYGFKQAPIGISSGTYLNRGVGMYSSVFLHPTVFKIEAENNEDKVDMCEWGMTMGGTFRVARASAKLPVWFFVGAGMVQHKEVLRIEESGFSYVSIPCETGLLVKLLKDRLALRYTIQYRFLLKTENATTYNASDRVAKTKHSIGIGICF